MAQNETRPDRRGLPASGADTAPRPLLSVLAHAARASDALPLLHQFALDATGGDRALLFQHNPRNGSLQATSGFGMDMLPTDAGVPETDELAIVEGAFDRRAPVLVPDADRRMPDLSGRLGTRAALLLPLIRRGDRVGVLAVGFSDGPPKDVGGDVAEAADAFVAALEL